MTLLPTDGPQGGLHIISAQPSFNIWPEDVGKTSLLSGGEGDLADEL